MAFNPTVNNISIISWRSVLLVVETTDLSQGIDKLYHTMLYRAHRRCICPWEFRIAWYLLRFRRQEKIASPLTRYFLQITLTKSIYLYRILVSNTISIISNRVMRRPYLNITAAGVYAWGFNFFTLACIKPSNSFEFFFFTFIRKVTWLRKFETRKCSEVKDLTFFPFAVVFAKTYFTFLPSRAANSFRIL
jgi:hypothetical protein